jgi:hypothetical protein
MLEHGMSRHQDLVGTLAVQGVREFVMTLWRSAGARLARVMGGLNKEMIQ